MESNSSEAQGAQDTTPSLFEHPLKEEIPPVEPITLPTKVVVGHTLPGPADTLPERDALALSTKPEVETPKDLPIGQATSPIKVGTQVLPTTGSVVKLASPLSLSNWAEGERQNMLVVTASVRRLNLEATRVILGDTVTTSAGGVAFENPQMAVVLPGPATERKVIGSQDATIEELAGKDMAGGHP